MPRVDIEDCRLGGFHTLAALLPQWNRERTQPRCLALCAITLLPSQSNVLSVVSSVSASRLAKTDMELEVLRYTNRISSEAHKMVRTPSAGQSSCGTK